MFKRLLRINPRTIKSGNGSAYATHNYLCFKSQILLELQTYAIFVITHRQASPKAFGGLAERCHG